MALPLTPVTNATARTKRLNENIFKMIVENFAKICELVLGSNNCICCKLWDLWRIFTYYYISQTIKVLLLRYFSKELRSKVRPYTISPRFTKGLKPDLVQYSRLYCQLAPVGSLRTILASLKFENVCHDLGLT